MSEVIIVAQIQQDIVASTGWELLHIIARLHAKTVTMMTVFLRITHVEMETNVPVEGKCFVALKLLHLIHRHHRACIS